jgi:hypothetical protein
MPTTSPISFSALGQQQRERPSELEIDRPLADAAKVALIRLFEAAATDPDVALEPCWRKLRVSKWEPVLALQGKLETFLGSTAEVVAISQAEFELLDEILACAFTVLKGEEVEFQETLGRTATFVGIAGGLAALIAFL